MKSICMHIQLKSKYIYNCWNCVNIDDVLYLLLFAAPIVGSL